MWSALGKVQISFFDGLRVRLERVFGVGKRLLLIAYGVREDGRKELMDFRKSRSEDEEEWPSFLNDLYRWGLEGVSLGLIITDGTAGLHAALEMVYPYTPRPRFWEYKLRDVSLKLSCKVQEECLRGAKLISLASNRREAIKFYYNGEGRFIFRFS